MSEEQAPVGESLPFVIQPVEAAATYALRHAVLWPEQPPAYVQLPDDDAGQHFGALAAGEVRAVISLFIDPHGVARFRKFAAAAGWQGRGLGTALLRHVLAVARAREAHTLWCDARQPTLPFYARFGLEPEGEVFFKGPMAYQRLSCRLR